ncbi:hypothetical protein BQ8482_440001 [Mesorhizobium delmotii]|uniref:HTH cro/C1-type domain-containing protein n=1 Tax=Mesorhizobium delmotii TaxID=1631247 RepID=A0A2P9ATK7_9HYPH|nr:hypothetical protein BQ8482_440001 [Mesorhizobium delmotii]
MEYANTPWSGSSSPWELQEVMAINIRRLRHEQNLTQEELAAAVSMRYGRDLDLDQRGPFSSAGGPP